MNNEYFKKTFGIIMGILIPLCVIVIGGYFLIQKSNEEKPWKPEKELFDLDENISYGPTTYSDISFISPFSESSIKEIEEEIAIFKDKTQELRDKYNFKYTTRSIGEYVEDPLNNESLQTEEFKKLKEVNRQNEIELLKTQLSAIEITIKNSYDNKNEVITNNSQYIIRDGDKIIKPYNIGFESRELDEKNWGINKTLKSGEETTGYIFFKETNFRKPVLEINSITSSYPIKIRLY